MLLDVRESHEKQIKDIIDQVTQVDGSIVSIPRVDLEYAELVTGIFNKQYFARDTWIVCLCQKGLRSGQALRYFQREGYPAKVLLGGIDALPT